MYFKQIFEPKLAQYSYLIGCQANGTAIIIDPMRDIDQYFELANKENLRLIAAADTHIHADYVSGLQEMAARGIHVYASDEGDADWKYNWLRDSDYNYTLLNDGDTFSLGNIRFDVVHTPGHTPEHISYKVTDGAATDKPMGLLSGDFVFVGDVGRPDLLETAAGHAGSMKPSAQRLFQSVEYFKTLPDYMKVWPAHGAGSACGKALGAVPDSTVGYEKNFSNAFKKADTEDHFIDYILDGQPEPPLYFARMKQVNKDGISVLDSLPRPKALQPQDLISLKNEVVIDTRTIDDFAHAHLKGALLSTWNKQFNTIAGSYVDPDAQIILIIDEHNIGEAVRDLVRVGLDHVAGYVTVNAFNEWMNEYDGEQRESLTCTNFKHLDNYPDTTVLDVRKATEFNEAHIEGALNIAHTRLANRLDELGKDGKYLVHCQASGRASVASALLQSRGYDVVLVHDDFAHAPTNRVVSG